MAVGAVSGALGGKFSDIGVDDAFIKEVGEQIEPGESALFMLVSDVQRDRVIEELDPYNPEVLQRRISHRKTRINSASALRR